MSTKVETIQSNTNLFLNSSKNVLAGVGVGVIAKYTLPLTQNEMQTDEYVNSLKKIESERRIYSYKTADFVKTIASKETKANYEDVFVNMFADAQEGKKVKLSSFRSAVENIRANYPEEYGAFRDLCKEVSKIGKSQYEQCIKALNHLTKSNRQTSFYMMVGAIGGIGVTLANKVLSSFKEA